MITLYFDASMLTFNPSHLLAVETATTFGQTWQARKKVVHSSTSGQDEIFLKSWYWDEIFLHFIRRF